MKLLPLLLAGVLLAAVATLFFTRAQADDPQPRKKPVMETSEKAPQQPEQPITKSDAEWREKLTPDQYQILRKAGTERANGEVYKEFKNQGAGTYFCAGCGAELFSSKEKFDSHCGWPSFYDPAQAKNVKTDTDFDLGYARTEVRCAICDGHLGHVFTGEGFDTPTDKRFCINGTVLKFVPADGEDEDASDDKAKAKPADDKAEK
jgi:peptide-methionine (R)-S-oxide reductase